MYTGVHVIHREREEKRRGGKGRGRKKQREGERRKAIHALCNYRFRVCRSVGALCASVGWRRCLTKGKSGRKRERERRGEEMEGYIWLVTLLFFLSPVVCSLHTHTHTHTPTHTHTHTHIHMHTHAPHTQYTHLLTHAHSLDGHALPLLSLFFSKISRVN